MTRRSTQLLDTANGQIAELHRLLSTRGQYTLTLSCPGRENLGDGTIAATAEHLTDTYHLLARFIQTQPAAPDTGSAGGRRHHQRPTTSTITNAPASKSSCSSYQPPPAGSAP